MSKQDEWVRVESEDELRPGMLVRDSDPECPPPVQFLLLHVGDRKEHCAWCELDCVGWVTTDPTNDITCVFDSIQKGLLFRLSVPPDEAALADEKEASRRAAKVKERAR